MEIISEITLGVVYDGTNGADVLALAQMQTATSGNEWSFVSEDETGLRLREARYVWRIPIGMAVVMRPSFYGLTLMTQREYYQSYRAMKDIFMDATNDREVLAALRAALLPDNPPVKDPGTRTPDK